jgi:hypothetical protein
LRVKPTTIRGERIKGKLGYMRIGLRIFYTPQQIADYLERQTFPLRKETVERPGQIGKYWLSKKPRQDRVDRSWCRTWYDEGKRQTCRVSLGTADFQEASLRLAAWVIANKRSQMAAPDQVLIETILLNYWNDYAKDLPSAPMQWLGLSY